MCGAFLQVFNAGFDYRWWCVEVRFADFQMNDAAALPLQFRRAAQDFEGGLATYGLDPLRNPAFRIQLQSVDSLIKKTTSEYNI